MENDDVTDPAAFETALATMTDDEVFDVMSRLEKKSESEEENGPALGFIQLVETEITTVSRSVALAL